MNSAVSKHRREKNDSGKGKKGGKKGFEDPWGKGFKGKGKGFDDPWGKGTLTNISTPNIFISIH